MRKILPALLSLLLIPAVFLPSVASAQTPNPVPCIPAPLPKTSDVDGISSMLSSVVPEEYKGFVNSTAESIKNVIGSQKTCPPPPAPNLQSTQQPWDEMKRLNEMQPLVNEAKSYINQSEQGRDCSAFVQFLYNKHFPDIGLPRTTATQFVYNPGGNWQVYNIADKNALQPGDIVFWDTGVEYGDVWAAGKRVSHVGLYIGDGQFVDANNGSGNILSHDIASYPATFLGGKRFARK